jgi:hypothetical protein
LTARPQVGHREPALELLASLGGVREERLQVLTRRDVPVGCSGITQHFDVAHRRAHLLEGEPERLHPPDHQDLLDVRLGVEPEPAVGAAGGQEEPDLLPVAQAAQRQLGASSDLTDVHHRPARIRGS